MSRRKSGAGYPLNLLLRFTSQKDIAAIPHATRFHTRTFRAQSPFDYL